MTPLDPREDVQSRIDGKLVARMIVEFHRELRDTYGTSVMTSDLCAVGPLQSMIGLAIKNGHLAPAPSSMPQTSAEGLREIFAEMGKSAADPMWADHVELPKAVLRRWIKAIRPALAPSQPAAVAVTDEMVERALEARLDEAAFNLRGSLIALNYSEHEAEQLVCLGLEAALRSTP